MNQENQNFVTYSRIVDLKRLQFIEDHVKDQLNTGVSVLDIGCGNGVISMFLGSLGFTVLGVDVSEKAIETARKNNQFANVSFEVKSAEQLISDGKLYDIIICSEVLEHLEDPSALLSVIHQTLSPNGKLFVTVPNGRGPRELFVTRPVIFLQKKTSLWPLLQKIKSTLGYSGTTIQSSADNLDHIQFFSVSDLKRLAGKNRFSIQIFGNSNFIEDVFPFSILAKRSKWVEKMDCKIADGLPHFMTGGFFTLWKKLER